MNLTRTMGAGAVLALKMGSVAALMLAVTGCAGKHLANLPVCDGRHQRPANPNGSILPSLPIPQPPSATHDKTSSRAQRFYPSC